MAQLTEMTVVRLTVEEREGMEDLAAQEDRSLAYMMRKAAQEYLAAHKINNEKE